MKTFNKWKLLFSCFDLKAREKLLSFSFQNKSLKLCLIVALQSGGLERLSRIFVLAVISFYFRSIEVLLIKSLLMNSKFIGIVFELILRKESENRILLLYNKHEISGNHTWTMPNKVLKQTILFAFSEDPLKERFKRVQLSQRPRETTSHREKCSQHQRHRSNKSFATHKFRAFVYIWPCQCLKRHLMRYFLLRLCW